MTAGRGTSRIPSSWSQAHSYVNNSFSSYTVGELLDCFRSENWYDDSKWCDEKAVQEEANRTGRPAEDVRAEMVDRSKIELCQEVENCMAASQGRPAAHVTATDRSDIYGGYCESTHTIEINLHVPNQTSYDVLDSVVHEGSHAQQVTGKGYDDHALGMMDVEGNSYNYNNFSNAEYDTSCLELDANTKAADFLLGLQSRFGDDSEYQQYILDREDHFSKVDQYLEDINSRQVAQLTQIKTSLENGDITPTDAAALVDNISHAGDTSQPFVDSTVQEHNRISSQLGELAQQYRDAQVANNEDSGPVKSTNHAISSFSNDVIGAQPTDSIRPSSFADDVASGEDARLASAHDTAAFANDVSATQDSGQGLAPSSAESSFAADVSGASSSASESASAAEVSVAGSMSIAEGQAQ